MINSLFFKVVLSLIGFLYFLLFATKFLFTTCHHSYEIKAKSDINMLSKAIELYRHDHGKYPDSLELLSKNYLHRVPIIDPWGNQYSYTKNNQKVILHSFGDPSKNEPISHVLFKKNITNPQEWL